MLYARRLRALVDSLPALIAFWDGDLRNVLANAAYLKWYGLEPEQIRGKPIKEVLGEDLFEHDLPYITKALAGEEQILERDLIDAAGVVRHTQTTYLPDRLVGEKPGFFAVDADLSAWVEATRLLDEAQHLAQLGSWTFDLVTETVVWSDELYAIFGEHPDSFTPTVAAIASRVHPDDLDRLLAAQDRARATGEAYDNSYRIVLPNGAIREVRSRGRARQGEGEFVRMFGTVQDMTDINAAARELARVNSELGRINEVNADVLAMLGHDVRAPLTAILGNLEILVDGLDPETQTVAHGRAQSNLHAAQRMNVLIEDILAMAAADAGELSPNLTDANLSEAVRDALGALSLVDGVEVMVDGGLSVRADPFHLRQILTNLITNALRYGEAPIVVSAVSDPGGTVTVRVRDHGPGVGPDALPALFERFAKSGTPAPSATSGPGTGFGLYMAARIAVLNHGRLVYEPVESGACFALTLPMPITTR